MLIDRYRLISFDVFQTLVDLNTSREYVLGQLFGQDYDRDISDRFWRDADRYVYSCFHRMAVGQEPFVKTADIFEACYATLFPVYGIDKTPREGACILAAAHNQAAFYEESLHVLHMISRTHPVCIISDTDNDMIKDLSDRTGIRAIYTSETYKSYKSAADGKLFRTVQQDYHILPEEMLHIGDGLNDVTGAKRTGAAAVWINRNRQTWKAEIKPDYEIRNLRELLA
jgi:FMN hydrolase / 5-amino-6-(5-phospho-D-ribitylamino)uracil phosphatase